MLNDLGKQLMAMFVVIGVFAVFSGGHLRAQTAPREVRDSLQITEPSRSAIKRQKDFATRKTHAWQSDLVDFEGYLREIAAVGSIPEKRTLRSDRKGGFVDPKPAADTVQFRVNEALKLRAVEWELELAAAPPHHCLGALLLKPRINSKYDMQNMGETVPWIREIVVWATNEVGPLKAGNRVKLKGMISKTTAIYHVEKTRHPVFNIYLRNIKITRIDREN